MYRTASFLKLVTLAILFTIFAAVIARTELSAAQLTLSWTDNSNNEDGFRVERKTGTAGTYAPLITLGANTVSHVDINLPAATTFCYRVNGFNSTGSSGYSNEGCATTASFSPPIYLLTVSKAGTGSGTVTANGINCGSDCSESVAGGTQVALTATAAGGSTFAGWTGTGCGSTATVTGNMTCTATFNLSTFTLTVAKTGTGSGTVTANGINCGSDCSESVAGGTQVALTATAAGGSTFAGWTGTGCASTATVTGNMTCTATFNLSTFTLTVAKAGTGSGTVTANGINCGSDCSESVAGGTQVALTATAAGGSTFAGWTGTGCASTATVTGNMTCTATFNLSTFTLTVAKAGTGSGTVTANGINCGSDCSESVASGTQVALTATAASGSTFAGWTGTGCGSTATVTGNMTCTATFNPSSSASYLLTVAKAGTGSGTVTATGINCGSDCSESVASGTQVALTATAASGSTFAGWTGTGCGSTATVTGNMTCTATFNPSSSASYLLTVAKAGTGSGTVTATGINCGSDCSESVASGTQVALTATPASASTFAGWTGTGCASTVTITGNKTCTATFNSILALMDRIGLFRPSTGEWFLDQNGSAAWDGCQIDLCVQYYGEGSGVPVVGEWDASGSTQLGIFGAESAQWFLDKNTNETWDGCTVDLCLGPFGVSGDLPVVGKWTSGGYDRVGVFRPSTGRWFLDKNNDGSLSSCRKDQCAYLSVFKTGDLPVVGDWKGAGVSQPGLFRPSTGEWFLDYNGNKDWNGCSNDRCKSFGEAGDQPVTGDWDGSGTSKVGVFRPSTGEWFLDYNGNGIWDGCGTDICSESFGGPGDVPFAGKW